MRRLARHIAPALLVLAAAACQGDGPAPATIVDNDYRLKHPVVVEPASAVLRLRTDGAPAVTEDDRRHLRDFAGVFVRKGSGGVAIMVGGSGADDAQARAYGQAIAQILLDEGLRPGELRLRMVIADPDIAPGQAALRFSTTVVNPPSCRDWSESASNAPLSDFGCAIQRNIGAMVADPRDLDQSRALGDTHSTRGDLAIDKMNQGEATWSVPLPLAATTKYIGGSSGGK